MDRLTRRSVRHPSSRFSRLQKEIAARDDAERKEAIHRRSRFFRHSRVTRRGLPNSKGGAAQAIGLRDHDRHRTPGRAVQGGDHPIVVRSTRCWREADSNVQFRGRRRRFRLPLGPTFPAAGESASSAWMRRRCRGTPCAPSLRSPRQARPRLPGDALRAAFG